MSVLIQTSVGNFVIDLLVKECPQASQNFLKLCKIKYYNGCLIYNIQPGFILQTGDPTGTGRGGVSFNGLLYGDQARFFDDEISVERKHSKKGTVSMGNFGPNTNNSQFFITLDDNCTTLDGRYTLFGHIVEGLETLDSFMNVFCDESGRPLADYRILHTHVLVDPFPDSALLASIAPPDSPVGKPKSENVPPRLSLQEAAEAAQNIGRHLTEQERDAEIERLAAQEAKSRAIVLEMVGDLPSADAAPPETALFVCKLNSVTTSEDLELIFSRFGKCTAEVVRDKMTGQSLGYAFVQYSERRHAERAYDKMDGVLIDDRRIKVDFSQSVAHLWRHNKQGTKASSDDLRKYGSSDGQSSKYGYKSSEHSGQRFNKRTSDGSVDHERLGKHSDFKYPRPSDSKYNSHPRSHRDDDKNRHRDRYYDRERRSDRDGFERRSKERDNTPFNNNLHHEGGSYGHRGSESDRYDRKHRRSRSRSQ